ncbi:hypothetical protein F9C07_11108 [Aspergillus flavus]|uniref:Uncharacterized protein n=1 Tax=Aspergillus flavus (strain ATCC 200026 / FGSC A1120 / IAM 13836 / NRRL 3357 / JCM 12722 / SRRC 167) TaxID=332952 RepID=A0A7U2MSB2_ASPFN|nr:hypothetical protein F9C07_11108 [Aspergillus flavus]
MYDGGVGAIRVQLTKYSQSDGLLTAWFTVRTEASKSFGLAPKPFDNTLLLPTKRRRSKSYIQRLSSFARASIDGKYQKDPKPIIPLRSRT